MEFDFSQKYYKICDEYDYPDRHIELNTTKTFRWGNAINGLHKSEYLSFEFSSFILAGNLLSGAKEIKVLTIPEDAEVDDSSRGQHSTHWFCSNKISIEKTITVLDFLNLIEHTYMPLKHHPGGRINIANISFPKKFNFSYQLKSLQLEKCDISSLTAVSVTSDEAFCLCETTINEKLFLSVSAKEFHLFDMDICILLDFSKISKKLLFNRVYFSKQLTFEEFKGEIILFEDCLIERPLLFSTKNNLKVILSRCVLNAGIILLPDKFNKDIYIEFIDTTISQKEIDNLKEKCNVKTH